MLVGAASAQLVTPPSTRGETDESAQLSLAGGVDEWTGGGGGALELSGSTWAERRVGRSRMGGSLASFAEIGSFAPFDAHRASGWLESARRVGVGVGLDLRGAWLGLPMFQASTGPRLAIRTASGRHWMQAGPLVRMGEHVSTSGAHAVMVATSRLAGRPVGVRADLQWLFAEEVPSWTGATDAWCASELGPIALTLSAGLATTSAADTPIGAAPAPSSSVVRGETLVTLPLRSGLALRATLGGERGLGAVGYGRVRALVGVTTWWRRSARPEPLAIEPDGAHFAVYAPAAAEVAVVGEWNAWKPVPLKPVEDGWWGSVVEVPAGRWQYAYLVDGRAVTPPESTARVDDGFGGTNGLIVLEQ